MTHTITGVIHPCDETFEPKLTIEGTDMVRGEFEIGETGCTTDGLPYKILGKTKDLLVIELTRIDDSIYDVRRFDGSASFNSLTIGNLVHGTRTRLIWLNLYPSNDCASLRTIAFGYESQAQAERAADGQEHKALAVGVPVQVEF